MTSKAADQSKTTKKQFNTEFFTKKSFYWFESKKQGLTILTYIVGGVEHYFGHTIEVLSPPDIDRVVLVDGFGDWIPLIASVLEIECKGNDIAFAFTKRKFSPPYAKKVEGLSDVAFTRKNVYLYILNAMTAASVAGNTDFTKSFGHLNIQIRKKPDSNDDKSKDKSGKKKEKKVEKEKEPIPELTPPVGNGAKNASIDNNAYSEADVVMFLKKSMVSSPIDVSEPIRSPDRFFAFFRKMLALTLEEIKQKPFEPTTDFTGTVYIMSDVEDKFLGTTNVEKGNCYVMAGTRCGFVLKTSI